MAPINIYIVTANCGRAFVDRKAFGGHLFTPYTDNASEGLPDLVVLSLQEVAPMAHCFLGGSFLKPYFANIIDAVHHATPQSKYRHVITHNTGMTGIIVLAKTEIADRIQWIQKAEVGVGFWEMGNKGAVGIRLGYTTDDAPSGFAMTFVAAHLAAGETEVQRRNKDWENIVRGLAFEPVATRPSNPSKLNVAQGEDSEENPLLSKSSAEGLGITGMFDSQSALFFAGDLNYRTSDYGPGDDDHRSFPQPVHDTSDPRHYSHRLPLDQLSREFNSGKTLHQLTEAPINFPPTYKYETKSHKSLPQARGIGDETSTWAWAKHRYPSWCDRVLYSSYLSEPAEALKVLAYTALPVQPTTDHRPVVFAAAVRPELAIVSAMSAQRGQKAPFPLNPRWREQRAAARTKEVVAGLIMYLGWTWEGNGLLLATIIGAIGGWLVLRSLISV